MIGGCLAGANADNRRAATNDLSGQCDGRCGRAWVRMPSNNLYESDTADKEEYVPAANSSLLPRKRPMHGKMTAAILGGSVCLNAMLALYCVNMQFMKPLAYDRGQELAYLQMKDRELTAQKESLERTTQGLMQQKEQLLAHYKETESVGQKLETYKEKLRVDAQVERK